MAVHRILVADDEEIMRTLLKKQISRWGYEVMCVSDGEQAIEQYLDSPFDLVLTDLKMPGRDGIHVVESLCGRDPQALVVVMTAFGTIETAVEAMKKGAEHFVTKPLNMDELKLVIDRALVRRETRREVEQLKVYAETRFAMGGLVGSSPAIRKVFQMIEKLADSPTAVLVVGETGTGKELVAHTLHITSSRRRRSFVPVNCAAIPESLQESELFGHEKGAFTGANEKKGGLIEKAEGGTLFLDEIASAAPALQAKLLRVIETHQFNRVGSTGLVEVDFRLVCASNKNLQKEVERGAFREDLLYRVNTVTLELPPLRERKEDIPILTEHFLKQQVGPAGKSPPPVSEEAALKLIRYPWPGNVRELQHAIEHALVVDADGSITPEDLPDSVREGIPSPNESEGLRETRHIKEREYLIQLLEQSKGNVSSAARKAGLARTYLHEKLKRLQIDPTDYRG